MRLNVVSGVLSLGGRLLKKQSIGIRVWSPLAVEAVAEVLIKTDSKGRFRFRSKLLNKGSGAQRLQVRYAAGGGSAPERVAFVELPLTWKKTVFDAGSIDLPLAPLMAAGVILNAESLPMPRADVSVQATDRKQSSGFDQFDEVTTKAGGFFAIYGEAPAGSKPRLAVYHYDFDKLVHWKFRVGDGEIVVRLEHGIEVLVSLVLDEDLPQRMLSLEMFPADLDGWEARRAVDLNGVDATMIARRRSKGAYRFGPFPAGFYDLRIRQSMSLKANEAFVVEGRLISIRTEGFGGLVPARLSPILYEERIEVLKNGQLREWALPPIDLVGQLKLVRITCRDAKGQPIETAGILPLLALLPTESTARGEQGEQSEAGQDVDALDLKVEQAKSAALGAILKPEPMGKDGEIEIVVNLKHPPAYVVSADDFVSVTIERLQKDILLKLRPMLQVRVEFPHLEPTPDGVSLEGALVWVAVIGEQPVPSKPQGALPWDYRALDEEGVLLLGVKGPGTYELRLRVTGKGEKETYHVMLEGPDEAGKHELLQVKPNTLGRVSTLKARVGPDEMFRALEKLGELIWE